MRFECPNCGKVTSSSFSLESGGYWDKYSRGGPWGCPTCGTKLDRNCSQCGCVGNSASFKEMTCPACGHKEPFPIGCLIGVFVIALLGVAGVLLYRAM